MTIFLTANNAQSNLAGSITAAATTAALAPGTGSEFPVPGAGQQFSLTFVDAATGLVNEIVYVTAMSGDTITTMLRGQEGTTPRAWLAGDLAANLYTEGQDAAKVQIAGAQNNIYTFGADTGSANAYALATSPTFTPVSGAVVAFTAAHANTGASTFALDGGTAYPIWGGNHSALQGGEIKNGYVELAYNPTLNSGAPVWLLLESTGASLQVAPATQSNQAVQLGQMTGRLLNIQYFGSSGTYTPTAGTNSVIIQGIGGGGAGGGAGNPGTGAANAGGPGASGSWGNKRISGSITSQSVTVGAGGAPVASSAGNPGGNTSFGSLVAFPGGGGGQPGTPSNVAFVSGATGLPGATPTGVDVGSVGSSGTVGIILGASVAQGGTAASTNYGAGGVGGAQNGVGFKNGGSGSGGAGGGGGVGTGITSTASGGNGGTGILIIYEYA